MIGVSLQKWNMEGFKEIEESVIFSALGGWVGKGAGGGWRSHSHFTAQNPFVSLKEALKQTLFLLLSSDMIDNVSCTVLVHQ